MDDDPQKDAGVYRAVRISSELDRALQNIVQRMSSPYQKVTLSGAIRAALIEGITVLDKKLPPLQVSPAVAASSKKGNKSKP